MHGRDLAFPYGPLGVLLLGPPEVGLALSSLVYALTVHLAFCAGLAVLCLRAGSRWLAWLAAAALLAIVAGFYTSPENDLSLAVAALVAPALAGSAIAPLAAVCAGALAALGLLVKLSVGTLAGALALAAAVRLALLGRAGRAPLAALVAGGGGVLTLALPLYFGGLGTFVDWLRLEASLATGYASAMSVPGRGSLELVGALPLLALPLAALAARRLRAPGAGLWLALLPALWLAYRHGYVRADGHLYHFDYLLLAWLLLAGVALPAGRARAVWAGVAALSLAVSLWTASRVERPGALDGVKLWTGQMGVGNLWSYLHFTGHVEALARASHEWLAPLRVESAAVARWRRRGTTFDVLPWDLLTMPANGLAWRPNPVLQLYQANTRKLDAWVAAHFASAAAPDALVVHFDPIDGRQLLWEAPATWREVLARYEPASEQPFPGRLVLAKRGAPRPGRFASSVRRRSSRASGSICRKRRRGSASCSRSTSGRRRRPRSARRSSAPSRWCSRSAARRGAPAPSGSFRKWRPRGSSSTCRCADPTTSRRSRAAEGSRASAACVSRERAPAGSRRRSPAGGWRRD